MTGKEFITWVQGYYAHYPVGQMKDVAEYVMKQSPRFLDGLKLAVKKRCSSEFRHAPDVSVFEKLTEEALTLMPELLMIEASHDADDYRDMVDLATEARRRGIDPSIEGWMFRLLFARVKEKKAKEAPKRRCHTQKNSAVEAFSSKQFDDIF